MKKVAIFALASAMALGLTACTPGNNVGGSTAVGAIAGGMLGSAFFHGSGQWAGILGGAVSGVVSLVTRLVKRWTVVIVPICKARL